MKLFLAYLLSTLFFFTHCIVAAEESAQDQLLVDQYLATSNDPLFISLGSFCGPASTIKTAGLRKASFPIDWMLSVNGEKIITMLDNDFLNFTDPSYLKPKVSGVLLNTFYNIEYSHEGVWTQKNFTQNLIPFKEKYSRRIERFRKLRSYKGKLIFIRAAWQLSTHKNYAFSDPGNLEITPEYSLRLYQALKRYFPNIDLYLIIKNIPQQEKSKPIQLLNNILILKDNPFDLRKILKFFLTNEPTYSDN